MIRQVWMNGAVALGLGTVALGASYGDDQNAKLPGPIDSISDVQDTAKMLFKLADTNNDNLVSQKEAVDAGDLLVGGFFFRADTNGDGVLSADEAKQARENLFAQQPLLKFVLERAKPQNGAQNQPQGASAVNDRSQTVQNFTADPMKTIGDLLDTNHDQKLEATEVRQAVQSGVQTLFLIADSNQDSQLSPYELNAAVGTIAKSVVQNVFQTADTDRNGSLSMDEYDKALAEPAHALFRVIDANGDNQISLDELQRAEQILADQLQRLRVPEPSNSISHELERGQNSASNRPAEGSPGSNAPAAPASPVQSAPAPPPRTQQ
jgi:Ca2+-binding EF-hand superfamily protein